jgi:four helix bundle protein
MATFKRFEDIEAWQKARVLAKEIFLVTKCEKMARDFKLIDQINGSSGSIMDNIAEGFGRGGKLEFIQFLGIAKGSAQESKSQLYRVLDREYVDEKKFTELYGKADEIVKMLSGLINYLNQSEIKGLKFKNRIS